MGTLFMNMPMRLGLKGWTECLGFLFSTIFTEYANEAGFKRHSESKYVFLLW